MEYVINYENLNGCIALPVSIISYLNEPSGIALKTLLLILSSSKKPDTQSIAQQLNIDTEQVDEAISFWISKKILQKPPAKKTSVDPLLKRPNAQAITSDELVEARTKDPDAKILFKSVESLYGRPLNPSERRVYLYALQATLLPVDVILMIVDYAVRINKLSCQYILKLCENWAETGITTHQQAEEKIKFLLDQNRRHRLIMNSFGISGRNLTPKEIQYIDSWFLDFHFSIEMITLAYEKNIDTIGVLKFSYINKILSNWYQAQIKSPEDVQKEQQQQKQKKSKRSKSADNPQEKPSYDIELLKKRAFFIPEE